VPKPNRVRRAVRSLAGACALALPACASFTPDRGPDHTPSRVTPPARTVPMPTPGVVPASAQFNVVEKQTERATLPIAPAAASHGRPLPIDLPTALSLAGAVPLDIQIAGERVRAATAQLDRAKVLWLPNLAVGIDYFRHDGQIQDVAGAVFTTSRSSFLLGAGPGLVLPVAEALYAPLAARQILRARQFDRVAARNDSAFAAAETYFHVQQARGEVAGSIDALRRAEELVKLTESVAPDYAPTVEINRAKTEAARRRQAVEAAHERWQVASADLTRVLRLEPGTLVEPAEEPALVVELFDPACPVDVLLPVAFTHRPELASDQAVIQAALARVKQEKVRPLAPTVAVRGVGSQVPGLAGGLFGGGINDEVTNFGPRFSVDLQAMWELQNLGFGNHAVRREREAEQRQALLQLLRTQDRVAAEVVQAHARVRRSAARLTAAEDGVRNAAETADTNLKGLVPGKRVGQQLALVFRPQEAVAAVAALDQAYRDYYAAVGDHNRAQFQLYRALGHPASCPGLTPRSVAPPHAHTQSVPPSLPTPSGIPAEPPAIQPVVHTTAPVPVPVHPAAKPAETVWRRAAQPN
jgi:outer membrane protein TolC